MSDPLLLERWIRRREAEAFSELVSRHAPAVFATCRRVLGSDADADDVTQECFVRLAGVEAAPARSLAAWLHAVAVRASIDRIRSRRRRRRHERAAAAERPTASRSSEATWADVEPLVDQAIQSLPETLRNVVVEHFLARGTQEDIARELGVSRQTVGHRLRQGVEKLRRWLRKRGVDASAVVLATGLGALGLGALPSACAASLGRLALSGTAPVATSASGSAVTLALGGVMKKFVIGAVAAVLALAGTLLFLSSPGEPTDGAGGDGPITRSTRSPAAVNSATKNAMPSRTEGDLAVAVVDRAAAASELGLSGVVRDADGRVVPDAIVRVVVRVGGGFETRSEATTGPAGEFEFVVSIAGDDSGSSRLSVCAARADVGVGVRTMGATDADRTIDVVLAPIGEISGRVYAAESGAGLADIEVSLERTDDPDDALAAAFPSVAESSIAFATDGDGRYALRVLSPARGNLRFRALSTEVERRVLPGARRVEAPLAIELRSGERRTGVDFALDIGGSIRGRVLSAAREPLEGATVELQASFRTRSVRRDRTDEAGRYALVGLATNATYHVAAAADGHATGLSQEVPMALPDDFEGVDVVLERGARVEGCVATANGAPLEGASVSVVRPLAEGPHMRLGFGVVVTDARGTFLLSPLAPGEYVVRAAAEGHDGGEWSLVVSAGVEVAPLELVLAPRPGGAVAGRVVDEQGDPVPATVVVRRGGRVVSRTQANDRGEFVASGLDDGADFVVVAQSAEHRGERVAGVAAGTTDLELVVQRRGRVVGRVVDAVTGETVERFEVRAACERPDGNTFHTKWAAIADEDGRFLLAGAEPAPVLLRLDVRADDHVEARTEPFSVRAGEESESIVVRLDPGSTLRGRVVAKETGVPIEGVRVRAHFQETFTEDLLDADRDAWKGGGAWSLALTDDDGRFAIDGLVPGRPVGLVAWREGYGVHVERALETEVVMALSPAASLEIRSDAVSDGLVALAEHRESRPWSLSFHRSARFAGGVAILDDLPVGEYRVSVHRPSDTDGGAENGWIGIVRLTLGAGEQRELPWRGVTAGSVEATVANTSEARVAVDVRSKDDPDERFSRRPLAPDARGRVRATGLPPGSYTVTAREVGASPERKASIEVRVAGGETARVELRLP